MFLPFQSLVSSWVVAQAIYEWEDVPPQPPLAPVDDGAAAPGPADACSPGATGTDPPAPPALPARRMVLKGFQLRTFLQSWQSENPTWNLVALNHRDSDEDRGRLREPAHTALARRFPPEDPRQSALEVDAAPRDDPGALPAAEPGRAP